MKLLRSLFFLSLSIFAVGRPLQAQQTTVQLVNDTGLSPSRYSVYAVGYSAADKVMLGADGKFVPIPSGSGRITGHKIGVPGGLGRIILDRSNPFAGGIVLLVVVPAHRPAPYVTFTDGGASIQQPTNPPATEWPDSQGKYIYQFIEITQPAAKNPTIDISMVNGFVLPINATVNPSERRPNGIAQVGQPLRESSGIPIVHRTGVFAAYRRFLQGEKISPAAREAYLELLTEAGMASGQRTAIVNPGLFISSGANAGSLLNTLWDPALQTLFETPGRLVGMVGDDGAYYRGTPTQVGSYWVLDFLGYTDPACTQPNGNHYRVYSPLTPDPAGSYQLNESAGCMVFANDGVFADSSANAVVSGPASVALGLQRDIVSALNRGVALLGDTSGTGGRSSHYWGVETNWYPEGQTYNVFSRFMHTARIRSQHINVLPPRAVKDAQGVKMGQSYGFAFDESPVHSAAGQPNVPSKFDPTPDGARVVRITLGSWTGRP